jgi:WD40 repeat protein
MSVAFSPDSTLLASGSWDKTIKLWQVADGQELATFYGHAGGINQVTFSPDGTLLASGSYDRTIKLWHLDLEEYLIPGCEWLQGYLAANPHVSEADRTVCDEILGNVPNVN